MALSGGRGFGEDGQTVEQRNSSVSPANCLREDEEQMDSDTDLFIMKREMADK